MTARIERHQIDDILQAALDAVNPARAVAAALTRAGDTLAIAGETLPLRDFNHIYVVGAGKAAVPMTQAVEEILGDRVTAGLVVTKTDHGGPTARVEVREAGHPVPTQAGVDAGRDILALAANAGADDLVIALISGGGSALLVAPAEGISLADLQAMTSALLASGATINEINCLRKHCSAVKGGQLARAAAPASLLTLVLSDVVGSPLDVIGSGPTVPDAATWADAWAIVTKYALEASLPAPILARLHAGLAGELADTPKAGDPAFARSRTVIVGDNRVAALAALAKAKSAGLNAQLLTTFLQGEAAQMAKVAVALGQEVQESGHPVSAPACLILGGETTVTLGANPGRGGRNQELALAAAVELAGHDGITIVSLATDGTDGPTDSAGGMADGGTVARGQAAGLDAAEHLRRHDAYPYLTATGDILMTGPTQTNVNDLIFVFVAAGI